MAEENSKSTLWGGRFSEGTDAFVQRFTASVTFDQRMAEEDIEGSLAHAAMLHSIGVLTEQELNDIQTGLAQIKNEIAEAFKNFVEPTPTKSNKTNSVDEPTWKQHLNNFQNFIK